MKRTTQNLTMTTISLLALWALSGCGDDNATSTASSALALYSTTTTRGTTIETPTNPRILSITHNLANVAFDFARDLNDTSFGGFYLHVVKLPYGTTEIPLTKEYLKTLHTHFAAIGEKEETIYTINPTGADEHNLTVPYLEANTTYAFVPSVYDDNLTNSFAKRDLLTSSFVIATTKATPLPDACLEVTCFKFDPKNRSRWINVEYGANPTWCLPKDDNNQSLYDGVRLYKEVLYDDGTVGNMEELFPEDGIFDTERAYYDHPLKEGYTYRYTLQAYNLAADGESKEYAENNISALVTIDPNTCQDLETP